MRRSMLVGAFVLLACSPAVADPLVRFGMTFGLNGNMPEAQEFGPMLGVGASAGRFIGEVNYSYLSFFDYDTRIHRFGVGLRMDLLRTTRSDTQSKALYGEIGAAERVGYWRVGEYVDPHDKSQGELQVALGYELADKTAAWQLALRVGLARRDSELDSACRSSTGMTCRAPDLMNSASAGVAESLMLEWTWILGHR